MKSLTEKTSSSIPATGDIVVASSIHEATEMTIKTWSYSRLIDFEACNLRAYLKYVDRIPEEKHPAAERGTAIHLQAEQYVKGEIKTLPSTLSKFEDDFVRLKEMFDEGMVSLEGEWGFNNDWTPSSYKEGWLRIKADGVAHLSPAKAVVIDYKTGRKDGNEIKHGEQVQLYAIATLLRNPALEEITVELWYLDKDELTSCTYSRSQALQYVRSFHARAQKMLDAKTFPANPTAYTCQWCPYSPSKGGQCPQGVSKGQSVLSFYRKKFG